MGISLSIVNDNCEPRDHPDWDCSRYSGDQKVANYISRLNDTIYDVDYYRPSDVRLSDQNFSEELFEASGYVNSPRWITLITILREHPDHWLSNE